MKKSSKKGFSFKGKVGKDVKIRAAKANSYGYLNLPGKIPIFKEEPDSRVRFDIIPYFVSDQKHPDKNEEAEVALQGDPWYKRPFKIHRNIGPGNGQSVVCPSSIGKKCPICEYRTKLFAEGDKDEAKLYNTSNRVLYNIIPLEMQKAEEKPHIWDISNAMFQQLMDQELKEKEWAEEFPSLTDGYTIYTRFASKTIGGSKPFAEATRIDFENREHEYDDSIMDGVADLDKILIVKPYKELEALLFELDSTDVSDKEVEEPDEEEEPKHTSRKKKTVRKPEPEPEEEEKEPEEEPEEEEEPPKRRSRKVKREEPVKTKRVARGKPEPEPEEEEEEEEEEADHQECPFGHKFGVDTDDHEDCYDCDLWDKCNDAKMAQ